MEDKLIKIFCLIDDFCKEFIPYWENQLLKKKFKPKRKSQMSYSEIMTIRVLFHQSGFKNFKNFYLTYYYFLKLNFPNLVTYSRFVELQKRIIIPLCIFLNTLRREKTGIYFIDSTPLKVCNIKRKNNHKVFDKLAKKSKSTMGWFYGFKLHLLINDKGEIIGFKITQANVDDRSMVEDLTKDLKGKLIGDKGYIKQELTENLWKKELFLLTKLKKGMKPKLISMEDKYLLSKRGLIESVIGQLKSEFDIEHTRHRSVDGFLCSLLGSLVAYSLKDKKPSIKTYSSYYQSVA